MAVMAKQKPGDNVVIKKYPNRRLYNTATSRYVTLRNLAGMVREDIEFSVVDPDGNDITRSVLAQIIVEEEAKGESLLPPAFLRRLITFYGDTAQRMLLPRYLEHSLDAFVENQDRLQSYMKNAFDTPFGSIEKLSQQNMAMFDQAMRMLTPFSGPGGTPSPASREPTSSQEVTPDDSNPEDGLDPKGGPAAPAPNLDILQQQIDALQNQLDTLTDTASAKKKKPSGG